MGGFRPDGPPPGNVDIKVHDMHTHMVAAIDINWTDNHAFIKDPHDLRQQWWHLAGKHGLGWGNFFDDAMHFSAMMRERGTGIGGQEITGDVVRAATGAEKVTQSSLTSSNSSSSTGSSQPSGQPLHLRLKQNPRLLQRCWQHSRQVSQKH